MLSGDDTPIRSLPKLFHKLILRVDDKRRIESLERMSLHVFLLNQVVTAVREGEGKRQEVLIDGKEVDGYEELKSDRYEI